MTNNGIINYNYDNNTGLISSIESMLPDTIHNVEFIYDNLNRLTQKISTIGNDTFNAAFEYKPNSSLIEKITYPTGLEIKYDYNDFDELLTLTGNIPDDLSKMCYFYNNPMRGFSFPAPPHHIPAINYQVETKNHLKQITKYNTGIANNLKTEYIFDDITGQTLHIKTTNKGTINTDIQDINYDYKLPQRILNSKTCNITNHHELYNFDILNRLNMVRTTSMHNTKTLNMEYYDNGNIRVKSDMGSYNNYDSAHPNGVQAIIPVQGFSQEAETGATFLFGTKVRTLSSASMYGELRNNTTLYYGYDKQRIVSEERIRYIEESLIIRKFVDKYYEEEFVYDECYRFTVPPEIIDDSTLSINGIKIKGYPYWSDSIPTKPGYARVLQVNGHTGNKPYYASQYIISFPIPEEVLNNYITSYKVMRYLRKLHYIYAEDDKLVGIYVFHQPGWGLYSSPTDECHILDTMYYIHQDHLGNYEVITDDIGTVLERLSYDVWGNRTLSSDWTIREQWNDGYRKHIFRRGFTGHEHLIQHGIINMNGRIYDPNTASFFSPDPFVASATSTQAFNRYSYCLNNPLIYTDPSGEFIFGILGIIGDFLNNISNSVTSGFNHKWTWNAAKTGWEVDKGWFRGSFSQILSRFTIEFPQTLFGYLINGFAAANG